MPSFLTQKMVPSDAECPTSPTDSAALLVGGEAAEDGLQAPRQKRGGSLIPGVQAAKDALWSARSTSRAVQLRGPQRSGRGRRLGASAAVLAGLAAAAALVVVVSKERREGWATAAGQAVELMVVKLKGGKSAEAGCEPVNEKSHDDGYLDAYRGWYDLQGCGYCNDYCRWVGNKGSGGNPATRLQFGEGLHRSFWSCRLAGDDAAQSEDGHFTMWGFRKCAGKGESASLTELPRERAQCKPVNPSTADAGFVDAYRGWFDVQGCGSCNDYCRWIGTAGSGGDPAKHLELKKGSKYSFWSCRLAGDEAEQSIPGQITDWTFRRCVGKGEEASLKELPKAKAHCKPVNPSATDNGYADVYRGWFDVQGCGYCNDYCRWIGTAGSGGDPAEQLDFKKGGKDSFWSCRLAGEEASQTEPGELTSWDFKRCMGKGEAASLEELPPPGEAQCKPANPSSKDSGYDDNYKGWYDVQGCGYCSDYCRWVGMAGSGGDPAGRLEFKKGRNHSYWSCRLAGERAAQSSPGVFSSWEFRRCSSKGAPNPSMLSSLRTGKGCQDVPGWHDITGDSCDWYSRQARSRCEDFGSFYANKGYTANTACCACMPEVDEPPPPPVTRNQRPASTLPPGRIHSGKGGLVVGDAVTVLASGKVGVLAKDDGSSTPYRVDFGDGEFIWYTPDDIAPVKAPSAAPAATTTTVAPAWEWEDTTTMPDLVRVLDKSEQEAHSAAPAATTTAAARGAQPGSGAARHEAPSAAPAATTTAACDESGFGGRYKGCQSKTRSGKTCNPWFGKWLKLYGDNGYCRADGNNPIWCFIEGHDWERCDPIGGARDDEE